MSGQRQPTELVIAKGRKHFTKEDIANRRSQEIDVPYKDVQAPKYITGKLKEEFYDIAYKLLDIGIMTELDEDCLARYLMSQKLYLQYTKMLNKAIKAGEVTDCSKLAATQDRFFKQARAAASDLGLTISSRCKLVIPETSSYDEL